MTHRIDRRLWAIVTVYLGNLVTALPDMFDQISYHTLVVRLLDGHGLTFATQWWPTTPAGEPTAHWSYLCTLYARFDQFVLLNTNAGYAFFWANHPIHGTSFEPILPPEMGSYQELIPDELHHLNEAVLDRALLQRGLDFIMEEPGRYLLLSFSRIPDYFMFWPSTESNRVSNLARVASFGLLWSFLALGIVLSLWRAQERRSAGRRRASNPSVRRLVHGHSPPVVGFDPLPSSYRRRSDFVCCL